MIDAMDSFSFSKFQYYEDFYNNSHTILAIYLIVADIIVVNIKLLKNK